MWKFIPYLLLVLVAASVAFDECMRKADEAECNKISEAMELVPTDAKELNIFCKMFLSSLNCLLDGYKNCSTDQSIETYLEYMVQYTERACNPGSLMYHVISSNLQCITSKVDDLEDICSSNKTREFLEKQLDRKSLGISRVCELGVLFTICDSVTMWEKCGKDVGRATLDILVNMDYYLTKCPQHIIRRIPDITQALAIAREMEIETGSGVNE